MELETVKVVSPVSDENPLGYIVINKSDLTDEQVLFSDEPAATVVPMKRKPAKADS